MSPADKSWSATTHCRGIAVYVPSDILPVKSKLLRVVISLNMHGSLLTRNFISFIDCSLQENLRCRLYLYP